MKKNQLISVNVVHLLSLWTVKVTCPFHSFIIELHKVTKSAIEKVQLPHLHFFQFRESQLIKYYEKKKKNKVPTT